MKNIKRVIEYDGTNYLGWQRQPQGPTIQQSIEEALGKITGEDAFIIGSGRTDSGVHALAQVANFTTAFKMTPREFQRALNSTLPKDIVIIGAEQTVLEFHSQYDAVTKTYLYRILNRTYPTALDKNRVWHVREGLDVGKMRLAAEPLLGRHDFRGFALADRTVKTTLRNVLRTRLQRSGNGLIEFEIEADGFLKRMVRLIVGTLVNVGKCKIPHEFVRDTLRTGNKTHFVRSAPPQGLFLKEVRYG